MVEEDTVKLLQECNAGIKMGVTSIDEVLPRVKSSEMREKLERCRKKHGELGDDTHTLLKEYGDSGKRLNPMARTMSWMKTNVRLSMDEKDETVADLITDGCNMGVKSLSRYLNEYPTADERSKDIAKRLISLEEKLVEDMRDYL